MKNKLFTLCVVLTIGINITKAEVYSGSCGDNLTWSLNTADSILYISGTGTMSYSYFNYPWYYYRSFISHVSLPDGLVNIGRYAFYGCSELKSVTLPTSVTYLNDGAFDGCTSLTSITLSDSLKYIFESVFSSCTNLTSIVIPNSVTYIGQSAFSGCKNLTSVTIGEGVTRIFSSSFSYCQSLSKIIIASGNETYSSVDGVLFNKEKTILVTFPAGYDSIYVIPNTVTKIGSSAFANAHNLTSVTIPNNVTEIGDGAFQECSNLTNIVIPNSVTTIGYSAFAMCYNLTSVTLPDNLTNIADGVFSMCSNLTSIIIPNSVTSIGNYAFGDCSNLTTIEIPSNVTSIGSNAFSYCYGLSEIIVATENNNYCSEGSVLFNKGKTILITYPAKHQRKSYDIPNTVTKIESQAFEYARNLTSITIPSSVTEIGEYAFMSCDSLVSISIPSSVTSIGDGAFYNIANINYSGTATGSPWGAKNVNGYVEGCLVFSDETKTTLVGCLSSVQGEIVIPNTVTCIGNNAFRYCSGITSVVIPNGVTSIGQNAFEGCRGLISIALPNSVTSVGSNAFSRIANVSYSGSATGVRAGAKCLNGYVDGWLVYIDTSKTTLLACALAAKGEIAIPNSVTSIGSSAFAYCSSIKKVSIPNSVTNIGHSAFRSCSGLKEIIIPEGVVEIGEMAFYECSYAMKVSIPNSVINIGSQAFYSCVDITCLGDTVPTLGNDAIRYNKVYYSGPDGDFVFTTHINVPCGALETYKSSWPNLSDYIQYANFPYSLVAEVNDTTMGNISIPQNVCEELIATPNYGYRFDRWSDGITDNPRSIELTQDTALIAIFKKKYRIKYICDNIMGEIVGDTIIPSELAADSMVFEAIPNYGYHFVQWNDSLTNNPRSIYLTQDTTFTAEFAKNIYSLTYIADSIKGTIQGLSQAEYLDSVTFEAFPNYGYHFDRWNDNNRTNPRTVEVTQDMQYSAIFAKNTYTITQQASPQEWGKVAGKSSSLYLDSVTITANPNYGYHFVQWSDSVITNPRKFALEQDTTFTAEFARNTYTITTESSNVEWGITSGDTSTLYLDTITLTATANAGYHFMRWNDGDSINPRNVVVTEDRTYQALFTQNQYTINKISPNGTISGPSRANYLDSITLTAQPNYGYHFTQWSDSVTDNPRTFVLTQDTSFTAEFAPNKYSVIVSCDSVRGLVDGESGEFDYLTEHIYTAVPNYGYNFHKWSDGVKTNPRTLVVERDSNIVALFANNNYSIKYLVNDSTMGSVQGVTRHAYLQEISFSAIPNHGYHFVQWSDSVKDNPRTFVLTQDTTFTAEFAQTFEGQCGDSLYWAFSNDSLVFSGSGDMYTYTADKLPWALLINQTKNIEFAQEMTSISAYAFQNMGNLSKLNLSAKIFTIGDFAFENCPLLNYVTIPNSVISLGESAFNGCSSIDTLIIGTGIRTITNQFRGCTNLRYVQLGKNIQDIDYGSFYDARQLIFIVCHPTLPPLAYPDEVGKERSFYNTNAQVLIPCDNFDAYQYDALWGSFNLKCLSSNSGTAVDGQVTVVAGDAEATFTWPTDGSADTYNLEITKDSATFCSLIFDSEGRLLGIAFAPSANGQQPHMPAATMTTKGMSFQVTGLDYASQYRFSFETKDDNTQTIFAYTGGFHTNGTDAPEGFNDINADGSAPRKVMIDGNVFILRGEKVYTLQGQEVR